MLTTGGGSSGYTEVAEIGWSDTVNTLSDQLQSGHVEPVKIADADDRRWQ